MKTVILGAGLAGLELGRQLKRRGKEFLILEKEPQIGGLAKTVRTGNYAWDFGVHALYSPQAEITAYYRSLPLEFQESARHVKIVHGGPGGKIYLVDYPFEEGIRDLPIAERWECFVGYIGARMRKETSYGNLEEWIRRSLGKGVAKSFMLPYNRKIWNCELDQISLDLVSAKIHPSSVRNFILAACGKRIIGRAYQARFLYPLSGIQSLMDLTAESFRGQIRLNTPVERLERKGKGWVIVTAQGREEAERVVSTLPLVELLKMIEVPGLDKEYKTLRWNDTYFLMVGLKPDRTFGLLSDCHWAFFKEDEIFYRITMMNNFSRQFLPACVAEITNKGRVLEMTREEILERGLDDLLRLRIVSARGDIECVDLRLVRYTYPIPTLGLTPLKDFITQQLSAENILLLGRSGHWDYLNMDGVIRQTAFFVEKYFDVSAGRDV